MNISILMFGFMRIPAGSHFQGKMRNEKWRNGTARAGKPPSLPRELRTLLVLLVFSS
jgi:hypothetical protein